MRRTVSSLRPLGMVSASISVLNPALYGLASIFWILSTCDKDTFGEGEGKRKSALFASGSSDLGDAAAGIKKTRPRQRNAGGASRARAPPGVSKRVFSRHTPPRPWRLSPPRDRRWPPRERRRAPPGARRPACPADRTSTFRPRGTPCALSFAAVPRRTRGAIPAAETAPTVARAVAILVVIACGVARVSRARRGEWLARRKSSAAP